MWLYINSVLVNSCNMPSPIVDYIEESDSYRLTVFSHNDTIIATVEDKNCRVITEKLLKFLVTMNKLEGSLSTATIVPSIRIT